MACRTDLAAAARFSDVAWADADTARALTLISSLAEEIDATLTLTCSAPAAIASIAADAPPAPSATWPAWADISSLCASSWCDTVVSSDPDAATPSETRRMSPMVREKAPAA